MVHDESDTLAKLLKLISITLDVGEKFSRRAFTKTSIAELRTACKKMVQEYELLSRNAHEKPKLHNSAHSGKSLTYRDL
jgi:hypothetical protein